MKIKQTFLKTLGVSTLCILFLASCKDSKNDPTPTYSADPVGSLTTIKTGTIVNVDGPGTSGTLAIVKDASNNQFVKLNDDFKSGFGTGTVVVYLAKTTESIKVQRNGGTTASNILALGFVSSNGVHYLKIPATTTEFPDVVIYCETAEINFGYSVLK